MAGRRARRPRRGRRARFSSAHDTRGARRAVCEVRGAWRVVRGPGARRGVKVLTRWRRHSNRRMPARDFRYHLLSIGINQANGAAVRSAERDAFGVSWTFAQLGYWRAERNRCVTGAHATASAIDAHLASSAALDDLD